MNTRSILKQTANCPLIPPDPGASDCTETLLRFSQTFFSQTKATFTIVFFAEVNHNYDHKRRTLKQKNTKRIEIHKSQTMTSCVTMTPGWPCNKPKFNFKRNYTLFGRHDTRKAWPTQISMILCTFTVTENFR